MDEGFLLEKKVYSPREFGRLYTRWVAPVTYQTVLQWIELARNTGGKQGIVARMSPSSRRYYIPAAEVERILLQSGAVKEGELQHAN